MRRLFGFVAAGIMIVAAVSGVASSTKDSSQRSAIFADFLTRVKREIINTPDSELDLHCRSPPLITNGVRAAIRNSSSYSVGETAAYACFDGFRLVGPSIIECMSNLRWSMNPSCVPSDMQDKCPPPPEVANSTARKANPNTGWTPGETVLYSCYRGFYRFGNATVQCLPDGHWTAPPFCVWSLKLALQIFANDPGCEPPPVLLNAEAILVTPMQKRYPPGTLVIYRCDPSYRIIGQPSIECTDKFEWETPPVCQQKVTSLPSEECSANPELPLNTKVVTRYLPIPGRTAVGSFIVVECLPGFEISDNESSPILWCRPDLKWQTQDSPIQCIPTTRPDKVIYTTAEDFLEIQTVTMGYRKTTMRQMYDAWFTEQLATDEIDQQASTTLEPTRQQLPPFWSRKSGVSEVVKSRASDTFQVLWASKEATTTSEPSWNLTSNSTSALLNTTPEPMLVTNSNETTLTPYEVTCHPPPDIPNGIKVKITIPLNAINHSSSDLGYKFSTRVTYDCIPEFFMIGYEEVICQESGNWTDLPICRHAFVPKATVPGIFANNKQLMAFAQLFQMSDVLSNQTSTTTKRTPSYSNQNNKTEIVGASDKTEMTLFTAFFGFVLVVVLLMLGVLTMLYFLGCLKLPTN